MTGKQNKKLASSFNVAMRKLEALFRKDAQQQIELKWNEIEVSV